MNGGAPFAGLIGAFLLMGAGGIFFFVGLRALSPSKSDRVTARLEQLAVRGTEVEVEVAFETDTGTDRANLQTWAERHWRHWMERAGGRAGMMRVLALAAAAALVVAAVAHLLGGLGIALSMLAALPAGAIIFHRQIDVIVSKRKERFLEHLPEAIDLIVRTAQAGIPMTEAFAIAGREVAEPVGLVFLSIAERIRLGVDLREALSDVAISVDIVDFDCLVVALLVQRESGGPLSETLSNLATLIRRRKETRDKGKALTAESRLTAKVIAALPFLIGGFLFVTNPDYMAPMIDEPQGRALLMGAFACVALGTFIIGRITRAEV